MQHEGLKPANKGTNELYENFEQMPKLKIMISISPRNSSDVIISADKQLIRKECNKFFINTHKQNNLTWLRGTILCLTMLTASLAKAQVDYTIVKTVNKSIVNTSDVLTYTLQVQNTGPGATNGSAAIITDVLPAGLNLVGTPVFTPTAGSPTDFQYRKSSNGVINMSVNLPLNASGVITYSAIVSSPKEPSIVSAANIAAPLGFTDQNPNNNHSTTQVFVKPILTTSNVKVRSGTRAIIDLTSTPNNDHIAYVWTAAQSSHATVNGFSSGEGTSIKQILTTKGLSGVVAYTVIPSVKVNRVLADGSIGETINITGDPKTVFVNVVTNPAFALSPKLPIAYGSFAANLADPAIIGNSTNIDYYQYFDRTGKINLTTTKVPAGDYYVEGYSKAGFSSGRKLVHIAAGPQPTLVMTTDKTSLIEGEHALITLSLSPSTVRLQEDLSITLNCAHNQFNSKTQKNTFPLDKITPQSIACNMPTTVTIPAGNNQVTIPVETLADNILYNDELLTVKAENPNLRAVTSKLSIEDATSLNPDNLVITLDGGTIKDNNTLKITARLPRGITTAKDITIALSEDPNKSNLNSLSEKPLFPASVTIPGDSRTNFSEFDVLASNPSGAPAKLVLSGTCIDCKINAEPIAILNPQASPNDLLTASNNEKNIYHINNINKYSKNEVQIVNRWGVLVYQAKGYDNKKIVFKGRSNRGYIYDLPGGTYYYVALLFDQKKKDIVKGSFQIKREGSESEQIGEIYLNEPETNSLAGRM